MTEYRTTVSAAPPATPAPETPRPAEPDRVPLWRRLAEAVVAGHRADVPF